MRTAQFIDWKHIFFGKFFDTYFQVKSNINDLYYLYACHTRFLKLIFNFLTFVFII